MSPKAKTLKVNEIKDVTPKGKASSQSPFKPPKVSGTFKLRDFNEPNPDETHVRLDQMLDQTIYIHGIQPISSDDYGPGFKLWFKDIPGAKMTYTAACFGLIVERQLQPLYDDSLEGALISEKHPFKVTIRKAGRSYKFEAK